MIPMRSICVFCGSSVGNDAAFQQTAQAAGQPPKSIEEFIGRVNSGTAAVSIARMKSPCGWVEPGQPPEFDEYTVVLQGCLHVKLKDRAFDVAAGQAIIVKAGEWVQYSRS